VLARQIRFLARGTSAWASDRDVRTNITRKVSGSNLRDFSYGKRRRLVEEVGMLWRARGGNVEEMPGSVTISIYQGVGTLHQ